MNFHVRITSRTRTLIARDLSAESTAALLLGLRRFQIRCQVLRTDDGAAVDPSVVMGAINGQRFTCTG